MSILLIFKYFKLCRLIKPIELNAKCKSCNQYAKEWAGKLYHSIFPKTKKKRKKAEKSLACQSVIKTFWFCWREKMLNAHNELTV